MIVSDDLLDRSYLVSRPTLKGKICLTHTAVSWLFSFGRCEYWANQAGLLTPLTFARYRLSPLLLLLTVRTFFTMEGGDSEFANFTLPTLKAFGGAHSHNVSGNKQ